MHPKVILVKQTQKNIKLIDNYSCNKTTQRLIVSTDVQNHVIYNKDGVRTDLGTESGRYLAHCRSNACQTYLFLD